jgi:diguanylate cyclase (GGDEF)-like protein
VNLAASTTPVPAALHESASALRRAIEASDGRISLAFIDVVGVGLINQRFGRTGGDALLQAFEDRLRFRADASERVWRLGGDEYVLLIPGRSARASVRRARSLRRQLARDAISVSPGHHVTLRFRAGGATAPSAADAASDLFAAAAEALQRAKRLDAHVMWSNVPPSSPVAESDGRRQRAR